MLSCGIVHLLTYLQFNLDQYTAITAYNYDDPAVIETQFVAIV